MDAIDAAWEEIESGRASVTLAGGAVALAETGPAGGRIPCYALHRALREAGRCKLTHV